VNWKGVVRREKRRGAGLYCIAKRGVDDWHGERKKRRDPKEKDAHCNERGEGGMPVRLHRLGAGGERTRQLSTVHELNRKD